MSASVVLPVADRAETRRVLVGLARPHGRLVAWGVLVLAVGTAAGLAVPLLLGRIVDVVLNGGPVADLDVVVVGLVAAVAGQGVLAGFGAHAVGRLGELLLAALREQVMDRALAVPLEDVERGGTGDLVGRVCGDVDAVSEATRFAIPEIVASALIIAFTLVGLASLDPRLALAGMLAVPVQLVTTRWYLGRSRPLYTAERAAEGARSAQLHASVAGARTVRALRLQPAHLARVEETSGRALELALATGRVRALFFSGLNAAELVGLATVLAAGFWLVQADAVTVGQATAGALFFHRLFDPIGSLLFQLDTAQAAAAALARLVGVATMDAPAEPEVAAVPTDAAVDLDGVRFAYGPGAEVLHGVRLHLAPGERVALVGASGAGKTTIAKLVAGVHAPTAGSVRIGGAEVAALPRVELARHVTLVTQEVHVFSGPLAADLRLARPDATDDDLRAALDRVGAKAWVEALPHGLATVVGNGGHGLGPTEAQQLALARLVLADPAVAVLDEATAEAGSAGARKLEEAAAAAVEGRTTLIVAHRLTQAASADRVVVLEAGRVVEDGAHHDLLAADGPYAELWRAWSSVR